MLWEPSLTSGTPHPLCSPQPQKQNQAAESPNTDWTTLHYPRIRYILLAAIYTQAIVVCFNIFKHLAILRRVQRASFFLQSLFEHTSSHFVYLQQPATSNKKQLASSAGSNGWINFNSTGWSVLPEEPCASRVTGPGHPPALTSMEGVSGQHYPWGHHVPQLSV